MTELTRRELMLAGMTLPGLLALSTARSALAALPQAPAAADPLSFVHPELRAAARQAQPLGQALSAMTADTLPAMRGGGGGHDAAARGDAGRREADHPRLER